jgi:D-apiose dehydrogenase
MLKGGIVGCGFFGQIQLESWRRMPEVEIVAAADPDLGRASRAAGHAYASAEEMLDREQLDFIDIATRPDSHVDIVKAAAERGLPVICQKPMAPTWMDAVAMVDAAENAGIRLMIHENWRWQPWYREAKRRIDAGDIGEPLGYSMRTRKDDGGGPEPYPNQPYFREMPRLLIYETLVHHIDTARFLFGSVDSVFARTRRINPQIAGEDLALLTLAHAGGLSGVIDGHRFLDPIPDGPAMGEAIFEGRSGAMRLYGNGDLHIDAKCVWTNSAALGYRGDSVLATQQHFIDCLRSGAEFETGGREYLSTFAVVEAAYGSASSGTEVRLG